MDKELLIRAAVDVVDMFDQANTNKMLEIGYRGSYLKKAIEELRAILNQHTQLTILSREQANN